MVIKSNIYYSTYIPIYKNIVQGWYSSLIYLELLLKCLLKKNDV